ncbi:DUF5131 family protein [Citricoccus parietis]|uniref:DUF5131 family protein n=1 Tax=Citricoccus parietis TaxID=592307 RepID=A0ABV5GA13_9MICC
MGHRGRRERRSARPIREEWIDQIHHQCTEYEAAFFFKQWGTWAKTTSAGRRRPTVENIADKPGMKCRPPSRAPCDHKGTALLRGHDGGKAV